MKLAEYQDLYYVKKVDFGVYLAEDMGGETHVLLPSKQVPEDAKPGEKIRVFLYKDSKDRLIATTNTPKLTLGEYAPLVVKEVGKIGAFLDWGLEKDLFLPYKEMTSRVEAGDEILVTLYIDKSDRLCASMKVYESLRSDSSYQKDDEVFGRVYEISENFGVFIAVDDMYSALLPHKEVFETYRINQPVYARVAQVLEDGRLTLSVRKKIPEQMNEDAEVIYDCLETAGGFLPYHDKSDPEVIKREFHMSKNAFKRAIGHLQKAGRIKIESNGIRMLS
jgi:predicted RNA-binding protein (virulence factor B family)